MYLQHRICTNHDKVSKRLLISAEQNFRTQQERKKQWCQDLQRRQDCISKMNMKKRHMETQLVRSSKLRQKHFILDRIYPIQCRGPKTQLEKKRRERKSYLTMYLREAYAVFKETVADGECCSFSAFCKLRPKHVLLLVDTPKKQCKCQIHENFFMKLKAMGCSYDNNF